MKNKKISKNLKRGIGGKYVDFDYGFGFRLIAGEVFLAF